MSSVGFDLLPVTSGKAEPAHFRLGVTRLLAQFADSAAKVLEEVGVVILMLITLGVLWSQVSQPPPELSCSQYALASATFLTMRAFCGRLQPLGPSLHNIGSYFTMSFFSCPTTSIRFEGPCFTHNSPRRLRLNLRRHSYASHGFGPPVRKSPTSARERSFFHWSIRWTKMAATPILTTLPPSRNAKIAFRQDRASFKSKCTETVDGGSSAIEPT